MFARRTIYSFERTTKVSCYKYVYTVEEKQKYHIIFFCEKNKSLILHHVLPNSPENVFLAAFVILMEESFYLIASQRKGNYVCKKNNIFLSTNNKSVMLQIFTLQSKNKSIILHHVLPNTPENVFLWPLLLG